MIEIPEFKELQFKEDTHTYTVGLTVVMSKSLPSHVKTVVIFSEFSSTVKVLTTFSKERYIAVKITTTYNKDGARTDTVELTAEEQAVIAEAVEIIKTRSIAAGYPKDYKDWGSEEWRLIWIMKNEDGCKAALKFARTAEISTYKIEKQMRGYA